MNLSRSADIGVNREKGVPLMEIYGISGDGLRKCRSKEAIEKCLFEKLRCGSVVKNINIIVVRKQWRWWQALPALGFPCWITRTGLPVVVAQWGGRYGTIGRDARLERWNVGAWITVERRYSTVVRRMEICKAPETPVHWVQRWWKMRISFEWYRSVVPWD